MPPTTHPFTHERLDAYHAAVQFVQLAATVISHLPRGQSHLADQLRRASTSIPLNIAEGAGEFSARDKARFYRIGRRSALECAAVLDLLRVLELADAEHVREGREVLQRVVAMLTRLILTWEQPDGDADADGD